MDVKEIRNELRKLSEIVGGWDTPEQIPALERDLALEKLRALYDAVLFAPRSATFAEAPAAAVEPIQAAAPVIDLGEVLSLEPLANTPFGDVPSEFSAFDEVSGMPESAGEAQEPAAEPAEEPAAEPTEQPVAEPAEEPATEPAEEPATEPAEESATEPAEEPAAEPAEKPAAEPAEDPVREEVPAKSRYVAPTLFGLEEETVRHRHKQRVIMSLYDTAAPAAPEKAAATPAQEEQASAFWKNPAPVAEPESFQTATAAGTESRSALQPEQSRFRSESVEEQDFDLPERPRFPHPETNSAPAEPVAGTVLGDIINPHVQTLADTIAPPRDVASELRRQEPVADLRKAIGINDKFLLIRDLFGGDGGAYEAAVDALNAFDNFDDCMIFIAENYAWNPDSDGAKLMMDLLERKFA